MRHLTKKAAQESATKISAYWVKHGYLIKTSVERCADRNSDGVFDFFVRSNLVNGLPLGFKEPS